MARDFAEKRRIENERENDLREQKELDTKEAYQDANLVREESKEEEFDYNIFADSSKATGPDYQQI